jgi:hypothetical protein
VGSHGSFTFFLLLLSQYKRVIILILQCFENLETEKLL